MFCVAGFGSTDMDVGHGPTVLFRPGPLARKATHYPTAIARLNVGVSIGKAMAQERSAFLAWLAHDLDQDGRIVAAWLGGSLGRGDADELSDIDIHLAINDDHCAGLNETRRAFVSQFGKPLLIQEAPQNAPPDGAFLLVLYRGQTAPVEVDWSWQPREQP
ncbi:MAG: nucleotidyltransferase domain-containing protein [Chloroflexi bacterium]|nr:nucleotidyltransferase domain-containing protein [Chloroflexota bacterium]